MNLSEQIIRAHNAVFDPELDNEDRSEAAENFQTLIFENREAVTELMDQLPKEVAELIETSYENEGEDTFL